MKYLKLVAFLIIVLFSSCKKDKPEIKPEPTPAPEIYPNYSQLKVSNYWVYQWFDVDENGRDSALKIYDSSYVEKDTVIHEKTYFKLKCEGGIALKPVSFLRDSLHYIVNEKGEIQFSSNDFTNVLNTRYVEATQYDTICRVEMKMDNTTTTTNLPVGNFKTLPAKSTYFFYPKWPSTSNPRYTNVRYAENVGIVSESVIFGLASKGYSEKRLLRYKVN